MNNQARAFEVEHKGDRRPFQKKTPKPYSHQNDLAGRYTHTINLVIGGEVTSGMLIKADQFTITIKAPINSDSEYPSNITYFKHAVTAYWF